MALFGSWAVQTRVTHRLLQSLVGILKYEHVRSDGVIENFNPTDLPSSAEHLFQKIGKVVPFLSLYEYHVKKTPGRSLFVPVVSLAMNESFPSSCPVSRVIIA